MTTTPPSRPLTVAEAEERLKRATFRIYLGRSFDRRSGTDADFYGTGFFVTDGPGLALALTAHHNFEGSPPNSQFKATYCEQEITLKWRADLSAPKPDIAVLELVDNPAGVAIEPVYAAYLDAGLPLPARRDFFKGRDVVIFGYPERDRGGEGWRVDGQVDTGQTIAPSVEAAGPPVERLIIHGARISQLEGLSGAAILDQATGLVMAVEGSYKIEWIETEAGREYWSGAGDVRGSEIAQLVRSHPELARHFKLIKPEAETKTPAMPRWLRWWRERQAVKRYRKRVIEEHLHFRFLDRAVLLDLDQIYIGLKVGKYVPPPQRPDEPASAAVKDRRPVMSGTIEAPQALLYDPPNLLVLGDPGSGKTTLLRYLALRIARRDPAFGEFARRWVPNRLASTVDGLQRRLAAAYGFELGLVAGAAGWLTWMAGLFFNPYRGRGLLAGVALLVMLVLVVGRVSQRVTQLCTVGTLGVLTLFGAKTWATPWAVGAVGLALLILLYPYWIEPVLRGLRRLRDRWTRYPIPFYLTLNDVAGSPDPIATHLARALNSDGFPDAAGFVERRLRARECLVLLDALDEVVDDARAGAARKAGEFVGGSGRCPTVVTCRIAAFEGQPLGRELPHFSRFEVQEFTERQIELFVRGWYAAEPAEARKDLEAGLLNALGRSPRLRLLSGNPLLLSLIALVYERDQRLPDRRVELYDECARVLLQRWHADDPHQPRLRFDLDAKIGVLSSVAARFHLEEIRQFDADRLDSALTASLPGRSPRWRAEFRRELIERSGLLRQKSKTTYDFSHLTFQEYFTALDFHRRGDETGLLTHLGDPWWREVILLFVGLQADAGELITRLRLHDLYLAAAALADARPAETVGFETTSRELVKELQQRLDSEDRERLAAADALAELRGWGAREYLLGRVQDQGHPEVALPAALALARATDRATLSSLWPQIGPVLRLLHGGLGRREGGWDERILMELERLGFPLVRIPAGKFRMGEGREQHDVELKEYWIGKYPVTNDQFEQYAKETGPQAPTAWRSASGRGKERHPVVNVSWHEALAFCKWAGLTLPSEPEWEKAARGTDGRTYPWGNQWDDTKCNVSGRGTTAVDEHPGGVGPCGCWDTVGNVWEWTRSLAKGYPYDAGDGREAMDAPGNRVLRGGSWHDSRGFARCAFPYDYTPVDRYDYFGFRVVASPF